ncbi:MAG: PKD domain-containing protein, partial [Caulobacteraceae bacterium]
MATPAAASPGTVFGTTANLSVLGTDDAGEGNINYTWATVGTPPASVTFTNNGTNAAKSSVASFTQSGTYQFQVTLTDAGGLSTLSSAVPVSVTVPHV